MANFIIYAATVSAQTLNTGESGLVQAAGNIALTSGSTVTVTGGAALGVLGSLASLTGTAPTVQVAGSNTLLVGAAGSILSLTASAIANTAAGSLSLTNQGQIIGEERGINLSGANVGMVSLVNSGVIQGLLYDAITVSTFDFSLVNHGQIMGGLGGVRADANNVSIENFGHISSISVTDLPLSSCVIVNAGTIHGYVIMGSGNDRFRGDVGLVMGTVFGANGNDRIFTGRGDDDLSGGGGDDWLVAGEGDDTVFGNEANDTMMGGQGSDFYDGGSGRDTVDYRQSHAAIEMDLRFGEGFGGTAEGDTLRLVEGLRGSAFGDTLIGDAGGNTLRGGQGADRLDGSEGFDTLRGDGGADTMNGGAGSDTVTYAGAREGVVVNLSLSGPASGGHAEGDVLFGIENLIGSEAADSLTGTSGANQLSGGGGADFLNGNEGNDLLTGGAGAATDEFYFAPNDGTDTITDFQIGIDLINLTAFGFTTLSQISDNLELSDDGTDTYLNFTNININSLIVVENRLFATLSDLQDSLLFLGPA